MVPGRLPILTGLPPVIGRDARVLVIGSFPSRESLRAGQYYANRRNQFWEIMGHLFNFDPALPYRQRTGLLIKTHVALWDALGSCRRQGSADNRITGPVLNDIPGLLTSHPGIRLIAANGHAALRYGIQHPLPDSVTMIRLPSTSPAYAAMSLEEKVSCWSVIRRT